MYIGLHVKYPLFCSDFSEILIFFDRFSKSTQMPNFMTIGPYGTRVVPYGQTGGWTDRHDDANNRFSKFCEMD